MSTPTTADLAQPTLRRLADHLAATVGRSPSVSRIQQLATPADDQELALLVEARDDDAADLWSVLDLLMTAEFGAILPGWRDPADGVERVYLLPWQGSLPRVRLRLGTAGRTGLALDRLPGEPTATEHVVEGLVLLHRMADHGRAGRFLAGHADLDRLRRAVCGLVRQTVAAGVEGQGWTGLDDALEATPLGRRCLTLLRELLSVPVPDSRTELAALVDRFLDLVAVVGGPAGAELTGPVDSYRRYLRII